MESFGMAFLIPDIFSQLPGLTLAAVADILILAFIIYEILLMERGTRAVQILLGVGLLVGGLLWGALGAIADHSMAPR